jgi:hypothetical protein
MATGRPWTPADARSSRIFVTVLDVQMLLGLLLYFVLSPFTRQAMGDMAAAMKVAALRFFLVEHLFQPTRAGCKKSVFCAIHALRLLYRHGGHEVLRRMREIRLAENPSGRQPSTIRLRFVPGHSLP